MQDKVSIEIDINENLCVEFTGEPVFHDESFTHEFGTEKITFWAVDEPVWDESLYSYAENQIINTWLYIERNYDKICQLLTDKIK